MLGSAALITLASALLAAGAENTDIYSPLRPPAVPLAVRGPYTNVWTSTREDGVLNTNGAMQWTGRDVGWTGRAAVDGEVCEWMGHGDGSTAKAKSVKWGSQWSNFTYECGGIDIHANFLSPVNPKDVCRSSIPLSYLQVSAESNDGKAHKVQLYGDVNGDWSTFNNETNIEWEMKEGKSTNTFKIRLQEQDVFAEENDVQLYGDMTYSSSKGDAKGFSYQGGFSSDSTSDQFAKDQKLSNKIDKKWRGSQQDEPVFAFVHDLGDVKEEASVLYTIGTLQEPGADYLTGEGRKQLQPWWKRCYKDADSLIEFHYGDFDHSTQEASKWEAQLRKDIAGYYGGKASDLKNAGSNEQDSYYAIVALSARQIMGAYLLTERPYESDIPYSMQKEISSNGNHGTVDVIFPATPFFQYSNIDYVRWTMDPMLDMQEATPKLYDRDFAMHDIGTNFPKAVGHLDPETMEEMPLEESGNAIIMALMYYKQTEDKDYLKQHYDMLRQFNSYLIEYSRYPAHQLSTDDFAGKLANQTNLAMKGIVGIEAMSKIAEAVGKEDDAKNFTKTAEEFYKVWKTNAVVKDGDSEHTLLSYNEPDSWGQLYNVWPAYNLELDISNQLIKDAQGYADSLSKRTEKYGIPLDSRHKYTKSDWEMWMAGYAHSKVRADYVTRLATFLQETTTDKAFTDLYETTNGTYPDGIYFIARPVAGGHYTLLANFLVGKDHSDVDS